MAHAFAARGAHVALASRTASDLDSLAAELGAAGGDVLALATDVADETAVRALFDAVAARWGRLDAACNAAGMSGMPTAITAMSIAHTFDPIIAVNLRGLLLCMRAEIALMRGGAGAIVNIASTAGVSGWPGLSAYAGSKHGVIGLTRCAALECAAEGSRIKAVSPGPIENDRIGALSDAARRNSPRGAAGTGGAPHGGGRRDSVAVLAPSGGRMVGGAQ